MKIPMDVPHEHEHPRGSEIPREQERPPRELLLPAPDALSLQIAEHKKYAEVNHFPKIPRPTYERRPQGVELAERPQVERRLRRDRDPNNDVGIGISIRPEERQALSDIGRFRVIAVCYLAESVYGGDQSALERDIEYLKRKGIVSIDSVSSRRDGEWRPSERIDVVTLTRPGRKVVERIGGLRPDQEIYSGLVKPREVEHDTQIYRAYLKEVERIEKLGGANPRVQIDFEIKRNVQKAIYAERKADPNRELNDIKQQVAEQFELPYLDNQIQIPDARITYDLDQGTRTGSSDIEVVTGAYRPAHLRSKAQSGFTLYASSRDRRRLGREIEDEHHIMHEILDLG